jgi:adenosylcobinamide hydrolase
LRAAELHTFDATAPSAPGPVPAPTPCRDPVPASTLATLLWRLDSPHRVASTAAVGGGIGLREWLLNVQVPGGYARRDVQAHVGEVSVALGLSGPGVGMLTAAEVADVARAEDTGVRVEATVGLTRPIWAAAVDAEHDGSVGTVNVVAFVPVRHSDAALANLLCTVTEAKVQALLHGGIDGTGTASDAVTVVCPATGDREPEPFGGTRSPYGALLARAVYAALRAGMARQ